MVSVDVKPRLPTIRSTQQPAKVGSGLVEHVSYLPSAPASLVYTPHPPAPSTPAPLWPTARLSQSELQMWAFDKRPPL